MQPWSGSQRVAVMFLIGVIVAVAMGRFAWNHTYISDPQPAHPLRENELADRIDPNTADAATLSALPLIGDKKAEDIVKYREKYVATHPGKLAFRRPVDLLLIHGIGASTISQLSPYLIFPDQAASKPTE
ncbi:hypothetical protein BH10PLA1_BH10PLA1_13740 [soil metagenome]